MLRPVVDVLVVLAFPILREARTTSTSTTGRSICSARSLACPGSFGRR